MISEKEIRIRVLTYPDGGGHYITVSVVEGVANILTVTSQYPLPGKGTPERQLLGAVILRALGLD